MRRAVVEMNCEMQNVIVMTLWPAFGHFVYRKIRAYSTRSQHDGNWEHQSRPQHSSPTYPLELLTADWGLIKFKLNGC